MRKIVNRARFQDRRVAEALRAGCLWKDITEVSPLVSCGCGINSDRQVASQSGSYHGQHCLRIQWRVVTTLAWFQGCDRHVTSF